MKLVTLKFTRRIILVFVLIATVLASSLVSLFYLKSNGDLFEVESITIGVPPNEQSALIFIAKEQNFFSANGLNVTVNVYPTALAALDGMLNGEVDVCQTAEFPLVSKALINENISVVACIDKFVNMFVVGRKDRGIDDVSDLKGKIIGAAKGTLTEFHLGRFLELHGITLQDVTIFHVPFAQSADALANGTVDAFQAPSKNLPGIIAVLDEDNLAIWSSQSGQPGFELISGTKDWVIKNSEPLIRLLKSLVQAEDYETNHPEEALLILQNKLGFDAEYMSTIRSQHTYSLSLDQSLILAMEDEARWLISSNMTYESSMPNFIEYIYSDYLTEVKPKSVNIIR